MILAYSEKEREREREREDGRRNYANTSFRPSFGVTWKLYGMERRQWERVNETEEHQHLGWVG